VYLYPMDVRNKKREKKKVLQGDERKARIKRSAVKWGVHEKEPKKPEIKSGYNGTQTDTKEPVSLQATERTGCSWAGTLGKKKQQVGDLDKRTQR